MLRNQDSVGITDLLPADDGTYEEAVEDEQEERVSNILLSRRLRD